MAATWTDAILAVLVAGRRLGTAFVVGDRIALTCAHVVQMVATTSEALSLRTVAGVSMKARIADNGFRAADDMCLLSFDEVLDSAPLPLMNESNVAFVSFGFPRVDYEGLFNSGFAHGQTSRSDDHRPRLDIELERAVRGFSGAPLVDLGRRAVIGMISEAVSLEGSVEPGAVASFAIPSSAILDVFPNLKSETRNPYVGLRTFSELDAPFYAGHREEVQDLVRLITVGHRLIIVTGPSGGGKSSLLNAGVIPQLRTTATVDGSRWTAEIVRPGDPSTALERRVAAGERRVIVVDQSEEVFLPESLLQPDIFLARLKTLAESAADTLIIVCRDDYFHRWTRVLEDWSLPARPEIYLKLVRLDEEQVRQIVCDPPRRLGVTVDQSVANLIFRDALRSEGGDGTSVSAAFLPLIELTLTQMWDAKKDGGLDVADFPKDGIGGTLSLLATDAIGKLSSDDRALATQLCLRLLAVAPTGTARRYVRRRAPRAELVEALGERAEALAYQLATDRIISATRDSERGEMLELVHDVLIDKWPLMHAWLDAAGADLALHETVERSAAAWVRDPEDKTVLLKEADLVAAEGLAQRGRVALSPMETKFLAASRSVAAADRAHRIVTAVAMGAVTLSLFIIMAAVLTYRSDWRQIGESSLGYASPSYDLFAGNRVLAAEMMSGIASAELRDGDTATPIKSFKGWWVSPVGSRYIAERRQAELRLWDAQTGQVHTIETAAPTPGWELFTGAVLGPFFDASGSLVASQGKDGTLRVWSTDPFQQVASDTKALSTIPKLLEHSPVIRSSVEDRIAWRSSATIIPANHGKRVLAYKYVRGGISGIVGPVLWDMNSHRALFANVKPPLSFAMTRDSSTFFMLVAVGSDAYEVEVVDIADGRVHRRRISAKNGLSTAITRDGVWLVIGNSELSETLFIDTRDLTSFTRRARVRDDSVTWSVPDAGTAVWPLRNGEATYILHSLPEASISEIVLLESVAKAVVLDKNGQLSIRDLHSDDVRRIKPPGTATHIAATIEGSGFLVVSNDAPTMLYDAASAQRAGQFVRSSAATSDQVYYNRTCGRYTVWDGAGQVRRFEFETTVLGVVLRRGC